MPVPLFLLPPSAQCVCVYVYHARTLCYARCVPISFVGSSRNRVASRRGRREGGGVHRRGAPPIEAISKSTKYTADEPASEQTQSDSLLSSIDVSLSLLFGEQFYTFDSAFPPLTAPFRTWIRCYQRDLSSGYQRGLLAREFHRRSDRFRG